jgi:hypothetical protein
MRTIPFLAVPALAALLACKSPEFKELQQSPPIVAVAVSIKDDTADAQRIEKSFAAALRARMATLVTVVPEGVEPPPDALSLVIEIDQIKRGQVSPGAVGAATGVAVTLFGTAVGDRSTAGNVIDGLFYGLWVGSEAAASQRHQVGLLGYVPPRLKGLMTMGHPEAPKPIFVENIKSKAVIREMTPLGAGEYDDYASINEKVARALAKAVANKLQSEFNWHGKAEPSWYSPTEK